MAFCYLASFDTDDIRNGLGTITFSRAAASNIVIDLQNIAQTTPLGSLPTSVYNHHTTSLGNAVSEGQETPNRLLYSVSTSTFRGRIQSLMQSIGASLSWASAANLGCAFSTSTLRYTFTYTGQAFTAITFSNTATRQLFGFATNFSGSSASVAGTLTPDFILQPSLSDVSTFGAEGVNYEPSGISATAQSDYGSQFGLARGYVPLFRDWTQQAEPAAKVFRSHASSSHPFTHQKLFEACRSLHPFVLLEAFGESRNYICRLRPNTCVWSANAVKRMAGEMDDALFNVSYRTQILGTIA